MSTRIARRLRGDRLLRSCREPEVPYAHALDRSRDPGRRASRPSVHRPGDGRGARDRRRGPAAGAVALPAALGDREPALLQLVRPAQPAGPQRLPVVRPPHGRLRQLSVVTGARRGVSAAMALLIGVALSVGIAACGGQKIAADEVTVAPPELTIPASSEGAADALAPGATSTPTPASSPSTTDTNSTTDSSGSGSTGSSGSTAGSGTSAATPQATSTPSSGGGAQAPAQSQPSTGGTTAPAPGSGSQKFEQFCE